MKQLFGWRGARWKEEQSRSKEVSLFLVCFIALFLAPWECKQTFFKWFLKTKASCSLTVFPLCVLPRSRSSQRPGGHFSADANSVQREVRSGEEPEAAAPCTAWDLHLMLEPGLSVSKGGAVWPLSAGREQAGSAVLSGAGQKTGNPPTGNIWFICMFTSFLWRFLPSVLQHLTFYFCIGNNWFNYRYRSNPVVAGGGRCGASERARNDTQVTCGKLVLGLSQLCKKKQRCSVYK